MKKEGIIRWVAITSLFLIPLNIKKFLAPLTRNAESFPLELSSLFLYLSEVFVVFLFSFLLYTKKKEFLKVCSFLWPLFLFFIICVVSIAVSDMRSLSVVFCFHFLISVLFTTSLAILISSHLLSIRDVMKVFAVSSLLQAEVAILQFINQGSIGLRFFGEEVVSVFTRNVAKVELFGSAFLRSYGTFPHPNILGGFLVFGIVAWVYLFSLPSKQHGVLHRSLSLVGLFVVLVGLVFSFSRSAWIAAVIAFVFCVVVLFKNKLKHAARELILVCMVFSLVLFGVFGWMLVSRGEVKKDTALNERIIYTNIALDIMGEYPFGVGIGNGMIRAEQEGRYEVYGLTDKGTHQPVHNIYLLITEEVGVIGILVFLFFVGTLFLSKKRNTSLIDVWFLYGILVFLVFIGFFDHYFLTINSGRLMFFSILGIMAGLSVGGDQKPL